MTDANNNVINGVVVTSTAARNGGSGTFAGGVNTATTTNGVATSAVFTANATAGGPYNVVASAAGATAANFSVTNLAAPPATVTATTGSRQSGAGNTAFATPLRSEERR